MASRPGYGVFVLLCIMPALYTQAKSMRTAQYSRQMTIEESGQGYKVSFECPEVFSDRVRQRLSSGFTSRVVVTVQAMSMDGKRLLAQGVVRYTIRYDIWEERFAVRVEGVGTKRYLKVRTMDDLVQRFGSVRSMYLMRVPGPSDSETLRINARIVVNPVSAELRRKVREYIANPDGRSSMGVPRSFFGSFSRIFVDEEKLQGDALLLYKSPPVHPTADGGG